MATGAGAGHGPAKSGHAFYSLRGESKLGDDGPQVHNTKGVVRLSGPVLAQLICRDFCLDFGFDLGRRHVCHGGHDERGGELGALPNDIMASHKWLPEAWLCGDAVYKSVDIRPGDELMCLGYPLGVESNDAGFPVLRSGRIASYPVHPSTLVKSYYYDVPVYGGNSGGTVFFDFRKRQIPGLPPEQWVDYVGVAGIIIQDLSSISRIESPFETSTRKDPLGLVIVVPDEFIKQTVAILDSAQRDKKGEAKAPDEKK